MHWQTARFCIDLARPRVMGIVNVTPDSFSDGGQHADAADAVAHCRRLQREGADLLDIGAESTRPGTAAVSAEVQWARLAPVLRSAVHLGLPVAVDTSDPEVILRALELGVDIVNDIRALRVPGALQAVAAHPSVGVCLMHMQGEPTTMQHQPTYADVVADVAGFLQERALQVQQAGVAPGRIVLDPGIGFGKTAAHNLQLLARQDRLAALGLPLLVGWSRKGTLGQLTGRPVGERLAASVAAALAAVQRGAAIVRVHDVAATVDALAVWRAVESAQAQPRH